MFLVTKINKQLLGCIEAKFCNKIIEHMRWKALAEIYTMHSFAPFWKLNFCLKIAEIFALFLPNLFLLNFRI